MIAAPIKDARLLSHLDSLAPDGLSFFTLGSPDGPPGGEIRGALLHGSRLVNRMRANHGLGLIETFVLGQASLASALLASTLKGEDRLGIRLDCEGPVQGWSVEAASRPAGNGLERSYATRGYLFNDVIELSEAPERFDTAPLVGKGSLTMTRFIAGMPRPFTGTVELRTGRLAQDLATIFLESEQLPTAFELGIHFDREGRVDGAGGLYLQALPGATASLLERTETLLGLPPPIGAYFAGGGNPVAWLGTAFAGLGLTLRGTAAAEFHCDCERGRFASFIAGAQGGLLEDLVEKGPWPVEAVCHQCGSRYHWTKEELETLLAERSERRPASPSPGKA